MLSINASFTTAGNEPLSAVYLGDVANAQRSSAALGFMAEPFGTTAAEENPSGLGAFVLPLRFPGQYFDQEAGLQACTTTRGPD